MRKRTWISLAVVAAVLIALGVTVWLRRNAPPEVARLLPESDAIVYINLKPLRTLTRLSQHPVAHDPGTQAFIDATGIEFERDLDQAAFALHRRSNSDGPNGPVAYSEVFRGRFDKTRLAHWLSAQGAAIERYAGHDIYSLQQEGRTVRVAVLGYDLVAVSNTPTAEQIHSMIDRYHASASPFSGNTLLKRYYAEVPVLSEAWGIGALGLPASSGQQIEAFGVPLPLPADTVFLASLRYLGEIHLRVEEIASSPDEARQSVELARLALQLLRSAQLSAGDPSAQQWAAVLQSTTVLQRENRAILRAVVPVSLARSLLSAGQAAQSPASPPQSQ